MIASPADVFAVLRQFNPWWSGGGGAEVPAWTRAAFQQLTDWTDDPTIARALLLSGARQVGKTTLFLQVIRHLLERGAPPANILYVTFDHPLLKLIGLQRVLEIWREFEPRTDGQEYLFLDEIQITKDWQTWIKHQVDFERGKRRIAVTGSATPLVREGQESLVGRVQVVKLATLSFYEYLSLRGTPLPDLPEMRSLAQLFDWREPEFARTAEDARPLVGLFHDYLLRGGFPQSALEPSIGNAQRLLREDIVDKVLKRDMTALFGVRNVLELEQVFLYLCLHDGGLLDLQELCKNLALKRPTVSSFIDLLEATHLIYRLRPFGYGKEVLRAKSKVYLSDPAIGPSVLLKGKSLLEDDTALGHAVEAAFFRHVFARYYAIGVGFSYWQAPGTKRLEVDIIADLGTRLVPFEVKYRSTSTGERAMKGLAEFCAQRRVRRAYVITKDIRDFGLLPLTGGDPESIAVKVPAPLACFWLGRSELSRTQADEAEA